MIKKITIIGPDGKSTSGEVNLRDPNYVRLRSTYKASVTKVKKGKGSYTRKEKHKQGHHVD